MNVWLTYSSQVMSARNARQVWRIGRAPQQLHRSNFYIKSHDNKTCVVSFWSIPPWTPTCWKLEVPGGAGGRKQCYGGAPRHGIVWCGGWLCDGSDTILNWALVWASDADSTTLVVSGGGGSGARGCVHSIGPSRLPPGRSLPSQQPTRKCSNRLSCFACNTLNRQN